MSGRLHLDPGFLRRLERLAIVARRTLKGAGPGERRSRRHGGTVEFADYRGYAPGDDTRRIDWYAYARLGHLFLKLYLEEQDLAVHLLLDQSASMGTGTPEKLDYARQLALALGYVALAAGDRVQVRAFRGGERGRPLGPLRGRNDLVRLIEHLEEDPEAAGRTSLAGAVRSFLAGHPSHGVVIVLSDLLDPEWEPALLRLRHSGHEPLVMQVLAPDELEPEVERDHELLDAETGEVVPVALDQTAVAAYRAAVEAFLTRVETTCTRSGIGWVLARTDVPLEELVLRAMRGRALLR